MRKLRKDEILLGFDKFDKPVIIRMNKKNTILNIPFLYSSPTCYPMPMLTKLTGDKKK